MGHTGLADLWELTSSPTRLLDFKLEAKETESPQGQEEIHYELLTFKQQGSPQLLELSR